ncbi:MAG TPA: D-alanyl-D-alanine carboxypeptidase/D-alanyl-D-alanine-endopeptidase [Terriglobales bacterium]|nr:D-alanyl-D-alanine carboxypeptidase/D-alanyl-D-alanine-endopeptidase [Terriglobales bacterium]
MIRLRARHRGPATTILILILGIIFVPAATRAQQQSQVCCASGAAENAETHGRSHKKPAALTGFAAQVEKILGTAPQNKGNWGLLVADAASGEVLYQCNADKYFVPASNMKLFTTALALAKLGPDFRFHTTLESALQPSPQGILQGPLYLVGRGDPDLSNRKYPFELKEEFDGAPEKLIAELADALVAKGIKEITGDIVGDDSYFPRERYPEGWEIDDMVWEYGAAISAIVVDDNTGTVTLNPGMTAGAPVTADTSPATPDFAVNNQVATSAAGVKPDLTLTREPGSSLVQITGTLPAGGNPRKLVLAIQEPALHAASLLKSLLEKRGVKVDGAARALHLPPGPVPGEARVELAEHDSIPLSESVKLINKISQNLHAEMLLRAAARQSGVWSKPEDLYKFPQDFYATAGIAADDVVQTDGSGLSRHDLITPHAAVTLLEYTEKQPWFPAYFDSLPVAGIDGTLQDRLKNTIAEGRIHAKTGSVEHVRTLSGFAELPSGRRLVFSFLSNNLNAKNHEGGDALDALCVAMIQEFDNPEKPVRAKKKHKS